MVLQSQVLEYHTFSLSWISCRMLSPDWSQFAIDGMQYHSWENAWRAAQPLKDAWKPHRAPATPTSDPPIHSDTLGLPQLYLESSAFPFSAILQSLTSISKPSILLFLTHTLSLLCLSLHNTPAWIPGSCFASCKACDLNRITQINSPKFILNNQHTNSLIAAG